MKYGFRERDIVAWRFTKRQSGYQGDYGFYRSPGIAVHTMMCWRWRISGLALMRELVRGVQAGFGDLMPVELIDKHDRV